MLTLLKKFENKRPEIVFEWKDSETEAEGWVVINSLRGGAAGGGTRMRKGLDKREVESLAKTMEVKFTVAGPAIGGAKSGINFDPKDPRKEGVLRRWYAAVTPLLKHYYGTGGDLNVDEIHEVIPITEDCGVWHPQEGVFNGHFQPRDRQKYPILNSEYDFDDKNNKVFNIQIGPAVYEMEPWWNEVRLYENIHSEGKKGKTPTVRLHHWLGVVIHRNDLDKFKKINEKIGRKLNLPLLSTEAKLLDFI